MAPPPPPVEPVRLTIALVGQTGNGKSATGNSLLGRDAFVAKRSLASVTERCEKHVALLDANDDPLPPPLALDGAVPAPPPPDATTPSTILRVIDTPGTCDSGALLEDNLRRISDFLASTTEVDGGVDALVFVLSAANRFTQEEADAMERLVARLGEGVLRHTICVFTRGEELAREETDALEFIESAPATLKQLLRRFGDGGDDAPLPILVENFPSPACGRSRAETAAAPLLAAVREVRRAREGRRYEPADAVKAARAAANDPATAALAMLDKLKQRMAAGPLGQDEMMKNAAMQAFDDLQAQFAARAATGGPGGGPHAFATAFLEATKESANDAASKPRPNRALKRYAAAAVTKSGAFAPLPVMIGTEVEGGGGAPWVEVEGGADVAEASGTLRCVSAADDGGGGAGGTLNFYGEGRASRARLAGNISLVGGEVSVSCYASVDDSALPDTERYAPILTLRSPLFVDGTKGNGGCFYCPKAKLCDDDWLAEGVYKCELRDAYDPDAPCIRATLHCDGGAMLGRVPRVRIACEEGTKLEVRGGEISLRDCEMRWRRAVPTESESRARTTAMEDREAAREARPEAVKNAEAERALLLDEHFRRANLAAEAAEAAGEPFDDPLVRTHDDSLDEPPPERGAALIFEGGVLDISPEISFGFTRADAGVKFEPGGAWPWSERRL